MLPAGCHGDRRIAGCGGLTQRFGHRISLVKRLKEEGGLILMMDGTEAAGGLQRELREVEDDDHCFTLELQWETGLSWRLDVHPLYSACRKVENKTLRMNVV
ncbi:hypothetical protein GOODEAATRI_027901 [Goodea atripinnis]|uniref:Uncharacterized protein n=1 Tax=Goodea atripinnis TaxID=208336 RepID=A0ABV0N5T9_9TELE